MCGGDKNKAMDLVIDHMRDKVGLRVTLSDVHALLFIRVRWSRLVNARLPAHSLSSRMVCIHENVLK